MGLVQMLKNILVSIPVIIYNLFVSYMLTIPAHLKLFSQLKELGHLKDKKSMLDVGVGTGLPLQKTLPILEGMQILGIDIDKNYIQEAKQLFKNNKQVEIELKDYYTLKNKYDIIYFSCSFMLMPNPEKALEIAKSCLNPGGKIIFLQTLHHKKSVFLETVKPWLKYMTTIDFGNMTYKNQFEKLLEDSGLKIKYLERITNSWSPNLRLFKFYGVVCEL